MKCNAEKFSKLPRNLERGWGGCDLEYLIWLYIWSNYLSNNGEEVSQRLNKTICTLQKVDWVASFYNVNLTVKKKKKKRIYTVLCYHLYGRLVMNLFYAFNMWEALSSDNQQETGFYSQKVVKRLNLNFT